MKKGPLTLLRLTLLEKFSAAAVDKPRFEQLNLLGEALVEFKNTPVQVGELEGKAILSDRPYPINMAPVNFDYFKKAARVFRLAEELGYKPEIEKESFPATVFSYPQAFDKMKTGSIEGIEYPIDFAKGVCKQISMCFYEENRKLSGIYRSLVKEKPVSFLQDSMRQKISDINLDNRLTELARESPEYIGPAGKSMKLRGRIHPDSAMNLSI